LKASRDQAVTLPGLSSFRLRHTDAFHLWTGELSGLTHFLIIDRKLINAVLRAPSGMPRCVPVLPTDLLSQLGIAKRDPLPFQYGARYTLGGVRYD